MRKQEKMNKMENDIKWLLEENKRIRRENELLRKSSTKFHEKNYPGPSSSLRSAQLLILGKICYDTI